MVIKKEVRSLGIDLCNPDQTVGAIVRGSLYLDGIVIFSSRPNRWNGSIANGVLHTRYYPELKLIMTHDPEQRVDARKVERITRLTVLEVQWARRRAIRKGFKGFTVGRGKLEVKGELETRAVQEILERTWTTGSLPEPLRVAHLIGKSRFLGKKPPILG